MAKICQRGREVSGTYECRREGGFTLVELLVVIGIIALLIAILLPALNRAKREANTAACASNMRQIAAAMLNYFNDNKGHLFPILVPYSGGINSNSTHSTWPNGFFWATELVGQHYIYAPWVKFPANPQTVFGVNPENVPTSGNVFWCPQCNDDADVLQFGSGLVGAADNQYPTAAINNTVCSLTANFDGTFGNVGVATWYMPFARLSYGSGNNYDVTVGQLNDDPPFIWYNTASSGDTQVDLELRNASPTNPGAYTRTLSNIRRSAQMVLLLEGNSDEICYQEMSAFATYPSYAPRLAGRHSQVTNNTHALSLSPPVHNTDAYTNIAFFDGHVALLPTATFSQGPASSITNNPEPFATGPGATAIFYLSDQ